MITFTMLIGVIFVILSKLPTILEQHLAPDAVIGLPLFRTGWNSELVCYGAKHFQTYLCNLCHLLIVLQTIRREELVTLSTDHSATCPSSPGLFLLTTRHTGPAMRCSVLPCEHQKKTMWKAIFHNRLYALENPSPTQTLCTHRDRRKLRHSFTDKASSNVRNQNSSHAYTGRYRRVRLSIP